MIYLLICEGRCNPMLTALDEAIKKERRGDLRPILSDWMVEAQKKLAYTPHDLLTPSTAECTDCGTRRQYGGGA